jgi:hypothetical protein
VRSKPNQTNWGFKDVVKNPKLWRRIQRSHKAADRNVALANKRNDSQIAAAVNHFIFDVPNSDEATAEAATLASLRSRVHSAVLQVLSDRSLRVKLVKPTSRDILPEAPFNRACKLLDEMPPIEAVEPVAPFLRQKNEEIRKDAAFVLGNIGTKAAVGPLRRALDDRDEYVRSSALNGLRFAIKNNRREAARALFGDVAKLVVRGKNLDGSVRLLLESDSPRATKLLLSRKLFTAKGRALPDILKAMADRGVRVPRRKLLALIADLERGEMNYLAAKGLSEALRLLGRHRQKQDRSFLEVRTNSPNIKVARGATAGLLASFGLEGFDQRIRSQQAKGGLSSLTREQQHYAAVFMYDAEVNNGGFLQYFFNSSGNDWRCALAGLEAMGFVEKRAILREAVAKFGNSRPSQRRVQRQEQLAKLARKNDKVFSALDHRYYKSTEIVEVIVNQYVLKNAGGFK